MYGADTHIAVVNWLLSAKLILELSMCGWPENKNRIMIEMEKWKVLCLVNLQSLEEILERLQIGNDY